MRLRARLTTKRAALMARFLEIALPLATDKQNESRFAGMSEAETKEVKQVLDDIYSDCKDTSNENNKTTTNGTSGGGG